MFVREFWDQHRGREEKDAELEEGEVGLQCSLNRGLS